MVSEICLVIIAAGVVGLVVIAMKTAFETRKTVHSLQVDLQQVSMEATRLLRNLNAFVEADLHNISEEMFVLVNNLNDVICKDSNSVFSNFNFFKQKNAENIPVLIKWIFSGLRLIKTSREFIKDYGKQTR